LAATIEAALPANSAAVAAACLGEESLKACSDIFDDIIARDEQFGPALQKVKTIYDAFLQKVIAPSAPAAESSKVSLDSHTSLQRENEDLREQVREYAVENQRNHELHDASIEAGRHRRQRLGLLPLAPFSLKMSKAG